MNVTARGKAGDSRAQQLYIDGQRSALGSGRPDDTTLQQTLKLYGNMSNGKAKPQILFELR